MRGHVFVGSEETSSEYVRRLVTWLRRNGYQVEQGDRAEIDTCTALVLVMTPEAQHSTQIARQLERAEALHRPVLALLLEGEPFVTEYEDVTDREMPGQLVANLAALTPAPKSRIRWFLVVLMCVLGLLVVDRMASVPTGGKSGLAALGYVANELALPAAMAILLAGALRRRRVTFAVAAVVIYLVGSWLIPVGRVMPIDFLVLFRAQLGYPAFYGLVGVCALAALAVALAWHAQKVRQRFWAMSIPVLLLAAAAGALDFVYWQPYGLGPIDTWPFILLLVIVAEAGFEPERAVRRVVVYAAQAVVVFRTAWVLGFGDISYMHEEAAAAAVAALGLAALVLGLVRRSAVDALASA